VGTRVEMDKKTRWGVEHHGTQCRPRGLLRVGEWRVWAGVRKPIKGREGSTRPFTETPIARERECVCVVKRKDWCHLQNSGGWLELKMGGCLWKIGDQPFFGSLRV